MVSIVFSPELIYSFVFFFHLFSYFIVIANIFFFKSIAWNLLSWIPYSISVSGFRIPCFSAAPIVFVFVFIYLPHDYNNYQKKKKKKCRKKWQGGLKETIELMLIRPPQLQFLEDGTETTATDTK